MSSTDPFINVIVLSLLITSALFVVHVFVKTTKRANRLLLPHFLWKLFEFVLRQFTHSRLFKSSPLTVVLATVFHVRVQNSILVGNRSMISGRRIKRKLHLDPRFCLVSLLLCEKSITGK